MKKVLLLCWFFSILVFACPSWASLVTLYSGEYTGSELDQLVTDGKASYPTETPTINGNRLDFVNGTYRGMIYRLPIVAEGDMTNLTDLVVKISLDWDMLSNDNDLSFGISDQSQLLGACVGDTQEYWAVNGSDDGTTFKSSWIPFGSFNVSMPTTLTIEVGSESSNLILVNQNGESTSFNIDRDFDVNKKIDFFLGRDNIYEEYGIKSLKIEAQAQTTSPVPAPAASLLLFAGLGGLLLTRSNRKK